MTTGAHRRRRGEHHRTGITSGAARSAVRAWARRPASRAGDSTRSAAYSRKPELSIQTLSGCRRRPAPRRGRSRSRVREGPFGAPHVQPIGDHQEPLRAALRSSGAENSAFSCVLREASSSRASAARQARPRARHHLGDRTGLAPGRPPVKKIIAARAGATAGRRGARVAGRCGWACTGRGCRRRAPRSRRPARPCRAEAAAPADPRAMELLIIRGPRRPGRCQRARRARTAGGASAAAGPNGPADAGSTAVPAAQRSADSAARDMSWGRGRRHGNGARKARIRRVY